MEGSLGYNMQVLHTGLLKMRWLRVESIKATLFVWHALRNPDLLLELEEAEEPTKISETKYSPQSNVIIWCADMHLMVKSTGLSDTNFVSMWPLRWPRFSDHLRSETARTVKWTQSGEPMHTRTANLTRMHTRTWAHCNSLINHFYCSSGTQKLFTYEIGLSLFFNLGFALSGFTCNQWRE